MLGIWTHLGDAFPAIGVLGTKTGAARLAESVDGPLEALRLAGGATEADLHGFSGLSIHGRQGDRRFRLSRGTTAILDSLARLNISLDDTR